MAAPDMDVIKEIPGYKVIMKAIIKSQIQQLVEQLASHTDEESVILTASVLDGTLSHLGSDSGKFFLTDHEEFKSQFLGFCLKRSHERKREEEREKEEALLIQQLQQSQPHPIGPPMMGVGSAMRMTSPRFSAVQRPRLSSENRHQPYNIRMGKRGSAQTSRRKSTPKQNHPVSSIKTENIVDASEMNADTSQNNSSGDLNIQTGSSDSNLKGEATSDIENNLPSTAGSSLTSDISKIVDAVVGDGGVQNEDIPGGHSEDPVNDTSSGAPIVKVEPISESELELEITGVEPGTSADYKDTSWGQDLSQNWTDTSQDLSQNWADNSDMTPGTSQGNNLCLNPEFRMMNEMTSYTQSSVPFTTSTGAFRERDIQPRQIALVTDPQNASRFASIRVNPIQLRGIESKAENAKIPGTYLLNKIADLIFSKEELGCSKGVSSLNSNKMEAIEGKSVKSKKRMLYTQEAMSAAIQMVKSGKMGKKAAATMYGVPRTTLLDKLAGRAPEEVSIGPKPVFTQAEEAKLANYCSSMFEIGYPLTRKLFCREAKKILDHDGRSNPFTDNKPGQSWIVAFCKRNHQGQFKKPVYPLQKPPAIKFDTIESWFNNLNDFLYDQLQNEGDIMILNDPRRIFNMYEIGFPLEGEEGLVQAPVASSYVSIAYSVDETQVTVMSGFNANGDFQPPLMIFPGEDMSGIEVSGFPEASYMTTEDGRSDPQMFLEYLTALIDYALCKDIPFPIVLFIEGHSTHMSMEAFEFCKTNNIILYSLPLHASHVMHPATVGLIPPLKFAWQTAVINWQNENDGDDLKKGVFPFVFKEAWEEGCVFENTARAFERSGLFPFTIHGIDHSKLV